MTPKIQAIIETAIYVDDLDAAEDFYGRIVEHLTDQAQQALKE